MIGPPQSGPLQPRQPRQPRQPGPLQPPRQPPLTIRNPSLWSPDLDIKMASMPTKQNNIIKQYIYNWRYFEFKMIFKTTNFYL